MFVPPARFEKSPPLTMDHGVSSKHYSVVGKTFCRWEISLVNLGSDIYETPWCCDRLIFFLVCKNFILLLLFLLETFVIVFFLIGWAIS